METGSSDHAGLSGHPARLRVGIIGPGRAGTALGRALEGAGHRVVAAHAISEASVRRVRENFRLARLADPADVIDDSDLVLLTVPDDDLEGLARGLAETGAPLTGRMLAHASGSRGTGVLGPAARRGALPLALHPVMTFTGREDDLDRIKGTCFAVTADGPLRAVAEVLVIEMGGEPVFIAEESRPLLSAALALASGHLAAVTAEAASLLRQAGAQRPGRMLGPLLGAALDSAVRLGDAGLTGPAADGDSSILAAHLATLADASPGAREAYLALARLTVGRAVAAGNLRRADADRLLDVLRDG